MEAQLRLAREEEHVRPRRHQCGAFLLREGEPDLGLVLAERDVHDLTDTELHTIAHQHLAAARQPREHRSDVVDRDHAYILACRRDRAESAPNSKPRDLFRTVPMSSPVSVKGFLSREKPQERTTAQSPNLAEPTFRRSSTRATDR